VKVHCGVGPRRTSDMAGESVVSQFQSLERRWKGAVHCIKSRHRSQSTRASIYRFVFDNRKLLWADSTRPQISKKAPTVLR
jgi:hypothetical protein